MAECKKVKTLKDLERIFQKLTTEILGYPPSAPESQDKVRISWATDGMPAFKITDDITFIRINNEASGIDKQRDVLYSEKDADNAIRKIGYTRTHIVHWTIYGPNSYENAETIKNSLFLPQFREVLTDNDIFMILDIDPPVRFPENYNGQWWERSDFEIRFNEKVEREYTVPYIKTANTQVIKG